MATAVWVSTSYRDELYFYNSVQESKEWQQEQEHREQYLASSDTDITNDLREDDLNSYNRINNGLLFIIKHY